MAHYDESTLGRLLGSMTPDSAATVFATQIIPSLLGSWLDDYAHGTTSHDVVETTASGFSYLFDIEHQRLVAAWGFSQGRDGTPRDKGRMAGHPLGNGPRYHRGHAIPHRLGGPTDINLVPQLGAVNVGAFRTLENEAVRTSGALYFTYWRYWPFRTSTREAEAREAQTPRGVDQGLLVPGGPLSIRRHAN